MSIATTCPSCTAFFRLSDTLAGKRVQCQKCMTKFIVPSAGTKETQPGLPVESISSAPPAKAPSAAPPKRKPVPVETEPEEMEVEEVEDRPSRKRKEATEDDERPRRKRRDDPDDEEQDDDRPRRKRRDDPDDDDDDEDDRPRRRLKKKRRQSSDGSKTPMILALVGVGVVLLLCVGGVGVFALIGNRNPNQAATAVAFGPDNTFRAEGSLRLWDPTKDRRHFRLYTIPVEAGKTYEIDMTSRNLDSYLVLLDENNGVVAEDDDSGGNLNARIIYRADRAATFRIEASTFDDHETGSYTLTVRRR